MGSTHEHLQAKHESDEGVVSAIIVRDYVIGKVQNTYGSPNELQILEDRIDSNMSAVLVSGEKETRLGFVVCAKKANGNKAAKLVAFPEGDVYRVVNEEDSIPFLHLISEPVLGDNGENARYEILSGVASAEIGRVTMGINHGDLKLATKPLSLFEVVRDTQDPDLLKEKEVLHVNPAYEIVKKLVPLIVEFNKQSQPLFDPDSLEPGDR